MKYRIKSLQGYETIIEANSPQECFLTQEFIEKYSTKMENGITINCMIFDEKGQQSTLIMVIPKGN